MHITSVGSTDPVQLGSISRTQNLRMLGEMCCGHAGGHGAQGRRSSVSPQRGFTSTSSPWGVDWSRSLPKERVHIHLFPLGVDWSRSLPTERVHIHLYPWMVDWSRSLPTARVQILLLDGRLVKKSTHREGLNPPLVVGYESMDLR